MTKSRSLLVLVFFAALGCGSDAHQGELTYLPVREAEEQNAPNPQGNCPEAWKDSKVGSGWVLRTGSAGAQLNAAVVDDCGNIYIGWTADWDGYVEKFFPNGGLAWRRKMSLRSEPRSDVDSIIPTYTGGVLVSAWQGTTIFQGNGEPDPVLPSDYFFDWRFGAAVSHEAGWLIANSGAVAIFTPSSGEPLAVPLGSLAGIDLHPIDNYGYVGVLAFDDEIYRVLTIIPPKIPQSSYVRPGGEDPSAREEVVSSWETRIYSIGGETAVLEQRISIEDEVDSITWGRSASGDLLLAYVTRPPGSSASSRLWDGSAWVALGDEGFSATDFHLLPNGKSIVVGLEEQGDVGSFVGYTVDSGRAQKLDWTDTPTFLANGAKTVSVVLSSGKHLLAIGSDPLEGDLRGEVLPLE